MNSSQKEHALLATLIDIQQVSANPGIPDAEARKRIGGMADGAIKNIIKVPDDRTLLLLPATHRAVPYCPTEEQLFAVLGDIAAEGEGTMLAHDYKKMLDAAPALPAAITTEA